MKKRVLVICIVIPVVAVAITGYHYIKTTHTLSQEQEQEQNETIYNPSAVGLTTERVVDCMTLWLNRNIINPGIDFLNEYFTDEMATDIYESEQEHEIKPGTVEMVIPRLSNCQIIDNNTATIDYFESDIYAYRYKLKFDDEYKMSDYSFQNIIVN